MKRLIVLIILIVGILPLVLAGRSLSVNLLDEESDYVLLQRGDRVSFDLKETRNTLILDKIELDKNQVILTIFNDIDDLYEKKVPSYVTLTPKTHIQVDVDRDKSTDLLVGLYQIEENNAILLFQLPEEPKPIQVNPYVEEKSFFDSNKIKLIVGIIILLGIGLGYYGYQKGKK